METSMVITSYIESFLLDHTLKSFQTLEYGFRENNFFPNQTESQKVQTYSWLYTTSVLTMSLFSLIGGFLLDYYGTWFVRCFSHFFQLIGAILAIFISQDKTYLIWIAYPLFYGAPLILHMTNALTYDLFPKIKGTLTASTYIALGGAQLWYLIYKKICIPYSNVKYFWIGFIIFIPLVAMRTFLLMPKLKIMENRKEIGWKTRKDSYQQFLENDSDGQDNDNKGRKPTFFSKKLFKEMFRIQNVCLFLWFFIFDILSSLYFAEYQPWLRYKLSDDTEDISSYTEIYNYMLFFQIPLGVFSGVTIDAINNYLMKKLKYRVVLSK